MRRRNRRIAADLARAALALGLMLGFASPVQASPHDGLPPPDAPLTLDTPRGTLELFVNAARAGDWARAAYALDLRGVPVGRQADRGPELAEELKRVLDHSVRLDPALLPATPEGTAVTADGGAPGPAVDEVTLGTVFHDGEEVPVTLTRVRTDGRHVWVFPRQLVRRVPELNEAIEPGWIEQRMPAALVDNVLWDLALWQWLGLLLGLLLAYLAGIAMAALILRVGWKVTERTEATWDDRLLSKLRGPTRMVITLILFRIFIEELRLPLSVEDVIRRGLHLAGIVTGAWILMRVVAFVAETVEANGIANAEAENDYAKARAVRTQVRLLQRVANILLGIVAGSLMLLQFEVVRTLGMSLLASAGIAGVVLGLAAQKSIAGLLAGIQISITQPIRIGDTVIVEGEWGTIEEINLTYVVVKVWDERRLVVPISRFLEEPFENWTKVSPELHGTVFVYADYTLPVAAVREELDRILETSEHWDGRGRSVLVTDVTERTVQVRAMMTAADASKLWSLRCEVREKLVAWLRQYEDGRHLPRTRVETDEEDLGRTAPAA